MNNKPIPYNTGKVVIGRYYNRPNVVHTTPEDALWQDVLLGEHHEKKRSRRMLMLAVVGVLLAYVVAAVYAGSQR